MGKKLCIVHANCQGEPLIQRLMACPEFSIRYECLLITNYTREPIPDETLGQCTLFLYQHLGANWDNLASKVLLDKLPPAAQHLCIPNMFFKGYWPLWSGKTGFDYRCSHMDEIICKRLPPEETVMLLLHSNVAAWYDLPALMEETLELERNRASHTPIQYLDFLIENYGKEQLFNTINHPRATLMNLVAKGILAELKFKLPKDATLNAIGEPFPEFEQPINPKVAKFFGWDFGGPETEYEIYGRKLNFARYVSNYVVARRAKISDFIGFLQGDNIAI